MIFNSIGITGIKGLFIYSFSTWLVTMSFAGYWLKDYLVVINQYSEIKSLDFIQLYWIAFIISSLVAGVFLKQLKNLNILY